MRFDLMAQQSVAALDPAVAAGLDQIAALMMRVTGRTGAGAGGGAAADGVHATAIPRLSLIRFSETHVPMPTVYPACLCVVAQGRKAVMLGGELHVYDRAHFLLSSVDLPATGEVMVATAAEPYLCVMLELDLREIAALIADRVPVAAPPSSVLSAGANGAANGGNGATRAATNGAANGATNDPTPRGLFISEATPPLIEAVLRLLRLLETPEDIPTLAPLVEREILYRLLKSPEGWRLRQVVTGHGQTRRIAKAIVWLRSHFREPLRVERLAKVANMSVSSFHLHFKHVTAMSPLQYQKQLRLQEARKLLLSESLDAASAGHRVGYESPSQFSREYRRVFGVPPASDLRQQNQQQKRQQRQRSAPAGALGAAG